MKTKPLTIQDISVDSTPENRNEATAFYTEFYKNSLKIKTVEIIDLGYRLTVRYIVVKPPYKLFELLPQGSSRPANACFLTTNPRLGGVIVPYPFQEHKARLKPWAP